MIAGDGHSQESSRSLLDHLRPDDSDLAYRDELTDLYNRRLLSRVFEESHGFLGSGLRFLAKSTNLRTQPLITVITLLLVDGDEKRRPDPGGARDMLGDRFLYCLWAVMFLLSGSTQATTSTPNGWKFILENAGGHSVLDSVSPGSQPMYFTYEPVELVLKYEITSRPDLSVRPDRMGPDVVDILRRVEVRIEPVAGDGEVEIRRLSSVGFRWINLLRDGSYRNLPLEDVQSDGTTLDVGDTVLFRFALEDLSPGDWRLVAVLPSTSEWKTAERQSVVVDVRAGDETEELEKYYLRQRRLIEPWPEYRKLTLQLIELEPGDWTLWRDLGARAITYGDSGEALHFLERARAVLEAEIQRGTFVPEVQVTGLDTLLEFRDFRSVYERERLGSKREVGLRLRPIEDGFEWRWFDVQTGLSMNHFDVSDPSPDLEELESAMAEIGEDRIPLSKARLNQMGKSELRRIAIRPQEP